MRRMNQDSAFGLNRWNREERTDCWDRRPTVSFLFLVKADIEISPIRLSPATSLTEGIHKAWRPSCFRWAGRLTPSRAPARLTASVQTFSQTIPSAPLPSLPHRLWRGLGRPVSVTVRMKMRVYTDPTLLRCTAPAEASPEPSENRISIPQSKRLASVERRKLMVNACPNST